MITQKTPKMHAWSGRNLPL